MFIQLSMIWDQIVLYCNFVASYSMLKSGLDLTRFLMILRLEKFILENGYTKLNTIWDLTSHGPILETVHFWKKKCCIFWSRPPFAGVTCTDPYGQLVLTVSFHRVVPSCWNRCLLWLLPPNVRTKLVPLIFLLFLSRSLLVCFRPTSLCLTRNF